jgi:iron complex transport system permease protein
MIVEGSYGFKDAYMRGNRRKALFVIACIVLVVAVFGYTLTVGFFKISVLDTYKVIIDHITGNITDPRADNIIWNTRLPEAIMAVVAGASLAAAGAVMQAMMRNPLADPYMMGVSSGAALGASIAIVFGICIIPGVIGDAAIVLNAFVLSLLPLMIILVICRKRPMTPTRMILSGVAIMYVFSAVTTLLMITASSETLDEIYRWRVGTLSDVDWSCIPLVVGLTTIGLLFLMSQYRKYDIMSAGDNISRTLGVNPKRVMLAGNVVIALMTATIVSFTGTIGFIGLVGPHIARMFVGSEAKYLIPASAAFGALFLLCADSIAKVSGSVGLPVGIISALIGCPLFMIVLVKMNRKVWN